MGKGQTIKAGYMKYERVLWAALLAVVLFPVLAFGFKDVLARFGELSLFIYDRSFFNDTVMKAGGFLEYISSFMAQFLIFPWLGALLAVLLWEAVYWLSFKAFDIPRGYSIYAAIPVAMLLVTIMGYGDKVNVLLYRNVFYTATLGFLSSLAILLCCRKVRSFPLRMAVMVVAGIAGYLLFGAYGLLGVALAALSQVSHERSAVKAIVALVLAAAVIGLLPLAFGRNWIAGVPIVEFYNYDKVNVLPYILLAAFPLLFAFLNENNAADSKHKTYCITLSLSVLCSMGIVCNLMWKADAEYRSESAMYRALLRQDYEKVVKIYDKVVKGEDDLNASSYKSLIKRVGNLGGDERRDLFAEYYYKTYQRPSRLATELRMLAITYMGESGNLLFSAPQGLVSEEDTPFVSQYGPTIYRYWGLFNSAYVWTTATSIHGGWSYYNLKEAALAMLLAGNNTAAAKYLDILDNTLFYSKWSAAHRKYLTDSRQLREDYSKHFSLVCPVEDKFYSENGEIELKILEHFALFEQPDVAFMTPEYSECSVLWAMLSKDMDAFWHALDNYYGVNMPET
ncbi:MAG: hypothetical protein IKX11_06330, partial [Bacteroidales bacterium]|nr:hypothetical protein [Bacteroidales bacterium]